MAVRTVLPTHHRACKRRNASKIVRMGARVPRFQGPASLEAAAGSDGAARCAQSVPHVVGRRRMMSLVIHATLGVLTVVIFYGYNRYLYRSDWQGSGVTW